jgi:hypothetical protein
LIHSKFLKNLGALTVVALRQTVRCLTPGETFGYVAKRLDTIQFLQRDSIAGGRQIAGRNSSALVDEKEPFAGTATNHGNTLVTTTRLNPREIIVAAAEPNAKCGEPRAQAWDFIREPGRVIRQQTMRGKELWTISSAQLVEGDFCEAPTGELEAKVLEIRNRVPH